MSKSKEIDWTKKLVVIDTNNEDGEYALNHIKATFVAFVGDRAVCVISTPTCGDEVVIFTPEGRCYRPNYTYSIQNVPEPYYVIECAIKFKTHDGARMYISDWVDDIIKQKKD